MFVVIALGNPGEKYKHTRHNAGWLVVDALLGDGVSWEYNKYAHADFSMTTIGEDDVLFVRPDTFMNNSGEVIPYLFREYGLNEDTFVVIYDDIDLPLGSFKISHDRGDGGHNGLKSIIEHYGSKAFTRIRLGISQDLGEGKVKKPQVLGSFTPEEEAVLVGLGTHVGKALEKIVVTGREIAMNNYN